MPQLPRILPSGRNLPSGGGGVRAPQGIGMEAWDKLANAATLYDHVMMQADQNEAARIARETGAEMERVISYNEHSISDPAEFQMRNEGDLRQVWDQALESTSTDRAKGLLQAQLGDNMIRAQKASNLVYVQKRQDKAGADLLGIIDANLKEYAAAGPDEAVRRQKISFDTLNTIRNNMNELMISRTKAQELAIHWQEKTGEAMVDGIIRRDPVTAWQELQDPESQADLIRKMGPTKFEERFNHARVAANAKQAELEKQVKAEQEDNERLLYTGIHVGRVNQALIDAYYSNKKITKAQAEGLQNEMIQWGKSSGVLFSDQRSYTAAEERARFGGLDPRVKPFTLEELRAQRGQWTREDGLHIEALMAENLKRKDDANDLSKDPHYKKGLDFVNGNLPNTDMVDLDAQTKAIVSQARRDYDLGARKTKPDGTPFYTTPQQYYALAEAVVDTARAKMGSDKEAAGLKARLLPGIESPADVYTRARTEKWTPEMVRRQMDILLEIENAKRRKGITTQQPTAGQPANRNQAAKDLMRQQGNAP